MVSTFAEFNIYVDPHGAEEQYRQCPQCSTQRKKKNVKCLSVNIKKECWICHHCGWAGGLQSGTKWSEPVWQKPEYRLPKPSNPKKLSDNAIKFFADRGISAETVKAHNIIIENVYIPQIEGFQDAVAIPYYRDGEHINTKYRTSNKHFRLAAQAELILYGLDDIKDSKVIVWVEGELDKLSLYEAGIKHCVSVPNGAPPPESKSYSSKFAFLETAMHLLKDKRHVLWFDSDKAGQHLEAEIARRLGRDKCSRVRPIREHKDANDVLIAMGKEAVLKAVEHAERFPVEGIHTAHSVQASLMTLHEKGLPRGYSTGWLPVDEYYTVALGQLTIVTGIPNHGKSNWLDCLLVNLAMNHGLRFGIFSPENQPIERHVANIIEKCTQKSFKALSVQDVDGANGWVNEHFWWILPSHKETWSLDNLLEKAKTLVQRHGINGLVLDPWNEIEHIRPNKMSETDYISLALTTIRQFARANNVHVWVVAHPTKLQKDIKTGEYPPPTPYDINGSSNWRNKADSAITVYRNTPKVMGQDKHLIDLLVMKVRFKEVGKVGGCKLRYDIDNGCYYEVSNMDMKQ